MYHIVFGETKCSVELKHSENVFEDARKAGNKSYHVTGAPVCDYDLYYVENDSVIPEQLHKFRACNKIYPDYKSYDIEDAEKIDLSVLNIHKAVYFETLDEYSIEVARVALAHTDLMVYFKNALVWNFLPKTDRTAVSAYVPEGYDEDQILVVTEEFVTGSVSGNYHRLNIVALFNNLFYIQSLSEGKQKEIRYVELDMAKSIGIGGVLSYYVTLKNLLSDKGLQLYLKKDASRYPDQMLKRYFNIELQPEDADEGNTGYMPDVYTIADTYSYYLYKTEIDDSILEEKLKAEMDEYAEAVLSGHNTLGVLIRGTDYIAAKAPGVRKMASVDDMIPVIREWGERDGYDRIFLATEDQDILDRMCDEFGSMVVAISQVRHRVSDFTDVELISDLEKKENSEEEYLSALEDNVVNYFYALYILSKCNSYMCSGRCHGWHVVNSFNHGRFKNSLMFKAG